jgi:hypothetical protein
LAKIFNHFLCERKKWLVLLHLSITNKKVSQNQLFLHIVNKNHHPPTLSLDKKYDITPMNKKQASMHTFFMQTVKESFASEASMVVLSK